MGTPFGSALDLMHLASTPATPSAGRVSLYAKSDGMIYGKTPGGVEFIVAGDSVTTQTTSTTPAPTGHALRNMYSLTAQSTGAFVISAPSGTPVSMNTLIIRIKDNGTARAFTWNAIYRAVGVTLPLTTVISKTLYVGSIYNSADSKWDVVSVSQEV